VLLCGAPSGLCSVNGVLYVCDMGFQGVLRAENGQLSELVNAKRCTTSPPAWSKS